MLVGSQGGDVELSGDHGRSTTELAAWARHGTAKQMHMHARRVHMIIRQ
jgi:hypothetical protein